MLRLHSAVGIAHCVPRRRGCAASYISPDHGTVQLLTGWLHLRSEVKSGITRGLESKWPSGKNNHALNAPGGIKGGMVQAEMWLELEAHLIHVAPMAEDKIRSIQLAVRCIVQGVLQKYCTISIPPHRPRRRTSRWRAATPLRPPRRRRRREMKMWDVVWIFHRDFRC